MSAALELTDVQAGYGPNNVLKGISLSVQPGEIVTLIGANGAGKSTTLMAISGLVRCRAGSIRFAGQDITACSPTEIVSAGIAHVPEGRRVLPRLTVLENLELGAYLRKDAAAVRKDIDELCERFPILAKRRSQLAGTLSGGEQQMLAIARGLMAKPRLLLLDEPSLGLAPKMVLSVFEIIREINRAGTTVLLIEQNAFMALEVSKRGYVLETGQIVLSDASSRLVTNPKVKAAYLGG